MSLAKGGKSTKLESFKFFCSCFRAIGFSGTPSEAVHYGLNYLQHLVIYEDVPVVNGITQETSRILYPRLELPDVFQLQHHVNQVVSIFIKEAIIGKFRT